MSEYITPKVYKKNVYNKTIPTWVYVAVGILMSIVFIFCSLYIAFNIVYDYRPVEGQSMYPTLNVDNEDGVYINVFNKGSVGDIIVIHQPPSTTKDVIKRLIATEGDMVTFVKVSEFSSEYRLMVIRKGQTVPVYPDESYLNDESRQSGNAHTQNKLFTRNTASKDLRTLNGIKYLVVPEGHVFYLGDNRNNSTDCSDYGTVPIEKVMGRAEIIIKEQKDFFKQITAFFWQKIKDLF